MISKFGTQGKFAFEKQTQKEGLFRAIYFLCATDFECGIRESLNSLQENRNSGSSDIASDF